MDLLSAKRKLLPLSGPQDSGGGGGSATQTSVSDLPDWAKPAAQDTLARAQALTDSPYQNYTGERTAQFTPLQQQVMNRAGSFGPSGYLGTAANMAQQAGLGALGQSYQAGQFTGGNFTDPGVSQSYMSPYIQNALAPQLREIQRSADIQGTMDNARATQAGAFGGARQAIVDAERERTTGMRMDDATARGYQTAFEQAGNLYNSDMTRALQAQQLGEQSRQYGAGLGMQGFQTAMQGANTLGQLGSSEYNQQLGAYNFQNQLGTQQQQQIQNALNTQYQDFLRQQQYPYQQLDFMSSILRGTPMGTVSTLYQQDPSTLAQVAGAGAALYGATRSAKGGVMRSEEKQPKKAAGLADLALSKM